MKWGRNKGELMNRCQLMECNIASRGKRMADWSLTTVWVTWECCEAVDFYTVFKIFFRIPDAKIIAKGV